MLQAQIEIILIAAVVARVCALIGSFLVLRRMALMSDAISHAILFGIVLMFFVVESTTSPLLILAATLTGLLTVALVEALNRTQLVKEDAAIGLVFPLLFSIGVILISRYAANVHLDVDAVLLGELAFAPFNRLIVAGLDIGPQALWLAIGVGLLNLAFVVIFYKELKLATFDAGLAAALGFSPVMHPLRADVVGVGHRRELIRGDRHRARRGVDGGAAGRSLPAHRPAPDDAGAGCGDRRALCDQRLRPSAGVGRVHCRQHGDDDRRRIPAGAPVCARTRARGQVAARTATALAVRGRDAAGPPLAARG